MDVRKNLIVLIFVLSGVLGILILLNFQKLSGFKQEAQILKSQEADAENLPVKLSSGPIDSFNLKNGTNNLVFYEKSESMIYEIGFDGKNKKALAKIPQVSKIYINPNGKEVIASIIENNLTKKVYLDLEANKKIELDKNIQELVFSPDGKKIAYHFYDPGSGEANISISRSDGSNFVNILKTRIKNVSLFWPEENLIVFYSNDGDNQLFAFSIEPDGDNLQRITNEKLDIFIKSKISVSSPLKDYMIYIDAKDGKLYSLRL